MKKKLLVLAMTGIMAAAALTACGGKETATTTAAVETTVAETTAAVETTVEETTDAEAADVVAAELDFDKYLAWTSKEWAAANDDEKLNAAIVFSVYTTEALSGEKFDDATKTLVVNEMRAAEDIKNVVDQLETTLPTVKMSIKEFADTGVDQVNALLEAEGSEEATE